MSTERVTYRPEGSRRARTIYLDRVSVIHSRVLGEMLSGVEVDREGDEVSGAKFDQRQHLICMEAVVRRVPVVMDNVYGEYIEADQ